MDSRSPFNLMINQSDTGIDATLEKFESLLSRESFKGLKAILNSLSSDRQLLYKEITATNTYEELITKLGYRVTVIRQIHVQDCYSRLGTAGGIKTVLPYHDIPTQSSLPTVVNFDSTVTMTPKSAGFFNQMLAAFKVQLKTQ
jgi:hypothetical protein